MRAEFKLIKDYGAFPRELTIENVVSLTVKDGAYWIEERDKPRQSFVPIEFYSCCVTD